MGNLYLHEDLTVLVLVRLPAGSLFRFKRVSKSWNTLISSPKFIKLHINQTQINPKPSILVYKDVWHKVTPDRIHEVEYWVTRQQIHVANFSITQENTELGCESELLHHPFDRSGKWMKGEIIGSCNGLICLISLDERNICLCNPVINSYWDLPPKSPKVFNESGRRFSFRGFGYDDVHDDYKVVMLGRSGEHKVYSLRSNSWSRVKPFLDSCQSIFEQDYFALDGTLANCALHWILMNYPPSCDDERGYYSILAFDLGTDKHKIFPVPEVLKRAHLIRLSVLNNNRLVLCKDVINIPNHNFDLWVMKDYGLKDSWMKITIRNWMHDGPSLAPVPLSVGERNLIIHQFGMPGSKFFWYDLVNHRVIHNGFHPNGLYTRHTLYFVGSLVQPRP